MENTIKNFLEEIKSTIDRVDTKCIAKAINTIKATYDKDGRIYIFGNGGSLAIATHWVSDFNKTVFSGNLERKTKRFQAIRLPTTEEELSAWANDIGYDMVFAGPLENYIQENDCVIAISSSGNSMNIIKAVEVAKNHGVPTIGLSGFDGGKLSELADVSIFVGTEKGRYDLVESIHHMILHLMTKYFRDYFDYLLSAEQRG